MMIEILDIPGLVRLVDLAGRDQVASRAWGHWWEFEEPLPAALARLAEDADGAFYDVGANTGYYSVLLGRILPRIPITAFEPVASIADLCEANLTLNRVDARLVRVALGNQSGHATLHFPPDDHGLIESSASLNPDFKGIIARTETVVTQRLDDYNQSAGGERVGLMKIDVEGFEYEVLVGAEGVIARDRPTMAVEFLPSMNRDGIEGLLNRHQYGLVSLRPGLVINREPELAFLPDSWNQLLVPLEKIDDVVDRLRARQDSIARRAESPPEKDPDIAFLLEQLEIERDVAARELKAFREGHVGDQQKPTTRMRVVAAVKAFRRGAE